MEKKIGSVIKKNLRTRISGYLKKLKLPNIGEN